MKAITALTHLCVPALVTVAVIVVAARRETFDAAGFIGFALGSFLFYAAPHLWWLVIAKLLGGSSVLFHAGLTAASFALAAICAAWLFPADPSGLPLQWILYWPLAIALQVAVAVVVNGLPANGPR